MDRDDEFVEYVELRWSLLYRFTALLIGETLADAVTRAGLEQAHAMWAEIVESGSRDPFVKSLIGDQVAARVHAEVRAAVPGTIPQPAPQLVPSVPEPDRLRGQLDALEVRHRAVLGLRYLETRGDLEDLDSIGSLGLAPTETDSFAAEALAALLGPDQTEQDVFSELDRRAAELLPPLPPVAEILAGSRRSQARRRRRHATLTAAVAAALMGTSLLVAATDQDSRGRTRPPDLPAVPRRIDQVPPGTPPRTPYSVGNVLDLGRAEVTLPRAPTGLAKAGSDVVITYPGGRIELFDSESGSRSLLAGSSEGQPVVDPDGRWVAWQRPGGGTGVRPAVVVATSLTGLGRHRRSFPVVGTCCGEPFLINGITAAGQLIASAPADGRTWVWDLARTGGPGPVRNVDGLGRLLVTGVAGEQVVTVHRSGPALSTTVGVLTGNTFRARFSTDRHEPDFTVPGWIVYTSWDGTIRARRLPWSRETGVSGRREVTLRVPAGLYRVGLRREAGSTVVMDVRPATDPDRGRGHLVRCDLSTGSCQVVAHLAGPHHLAE